MRRPPISNPVAGAARAAAIGLGLACSVWWLSALRPAFADYLLTDHMDGRFVRVER